MTLPPDLRTHELAWSWHGTPIPLGVSEAGEGPAVLLLPALSSISTRHELRPLMLGLAERARVVAPDWPGFGDRPRPPVAWTPDALSSFLEHFVRQQMPPLHGTIAAGHAASYALHLAAQAPGLLGRLVLLAPTWRGPLPTMAGGDRKLFGQIRRMIGLPAVGPLLYRLNLNRFVIRRMLAGHVYSQPDALTDAAWQQKRAVIAADGARFGSAAFVTGGLDRVASRAAFLSLAGSAGANILLLYGAGTPPKSRAEMDALAALPSVQARVTPHGKLSFHEEFPQDVLPAIRDFLFA
jgi:pimeloyl-ACP methyl ester carboxylesterase